MPGAKIEDLLTLVSGYNPEVAAAALDAEAAVAKIYPAGALDDPTLNLSRDEGFRQTMLTVSQEFPLWGKRELRRGIAQADATSAKLRAGSVRQEVEERLKVAYAEYYAAEQAARTTHDIHALLHGLSGTVRARYAQGVGTQSDAIRADLEQTRIEPELTALVRDSEIARAKINALIGRPVESPLAPPAALRHAPPAATLTVAALMDRVRDNNPMLGMAQADISAAEGERKLVEKSWYPDVTLSVGADSLPNQGPRGVIGVGIKIPLQWGVRDAQADAASAKQAAARLRLDSQRLQIESDLKAALATLAQAQQTETLLVTGLSRQSEAAYRSALTTYQNGRGDLTPVLDTAHQQLEVRLEILRTQTAEQTALAAIERLIGGDL